LDACRLACAEFFSFFLSFFSCAACPVSSSFEGIEELEFRENLDIVAMKSKEGEVVPLVRVINPVDSKGAVERWLKEVETVMRDTVLDQCAKSLKAYTQVARAEWTADWPAQVVLTVNQIHWTQGVARAIQRGKGGLKEFLDKSNAELQFIVMKVRGELTNLQRLSLGALVVIDVHARDVVEHLIRNQVTEVSSFDWQAQMRYYFEAGGAEPGASVKVRMINAQIEYGLEYLGVSERLVITALTDRCYRTLMGALQLNLGGAPEGPAGTGQSRTATCPARPRPRSHCAPHGPAPACLPVCRVACRAVLLLHA